MSHRIAALYRFGSPELVVSELRGVLHRAGASLVRPQYGCILVLDAEGDQVPSTEADLLRLLHEEDEVSFQWWLEVNADIYCRVRKVGAVVVVEFGFEGLTVQERSPAASALLEYVQREREHVIAYVYDPEGVTEDRDLDSHFLLGELLDWRHSDVDFPDVLVVHETLQFRLKNVSSRVKRTAGNGLVILEFRRPG